MSIEITIYAACALECGWDGLFLLRIRIPNGREGTLRFPANSFNFPPEAQ